MSRLPKCFSSSLQSINRFRWLNWCWRSIFWWLFRQKVHFLVQTRRFWAVSADFQLEFAVWMVPSYELSFFFIYFFHHVKMNNNKNKLNRLFFQVFQFCFELQIFFLKFHNGLLAWIILKSWNEVHHSDCTERDTQFRYPLFVKPPLTRHEFLDTYLKLKSVFSISLFCCSCMTLFEVIIVNQCGSERFEPDFSWETSSLSFLQVAPWQFRWHLYDIEQLFLWKHLLLFSLPVAPNLKLHIINF